MNGPHVMTQSMVGIVPSKPGVYILGSDANQALYVGRSDVNLRAQLLSHWVPTAGDVVVVTKFWYELATSPFHAYLTECQWYHQYSPLHNISHPARPLGSLMRCPVCGR